MKLKQFTTYVLALMMLANGSTALAASFSDTGNHWANSSIEQMAASKRITGYPDGTFKPDRQVSRAEFVNMANQTFGLSGTAANTNFNDVKSADWFYPQVSAAQSAGYIQGYPDGTFKPNQSISREEAAAVLARLLKLDTSTSSTLTVKDAEVIDSWAKASVSALLSKQIFNGYEDGSFKPFAPISRAEAATAFQRSWELNQLSVSAPTDGKFNISNVNGANGLVTVIFNQAWTTEPTLADFKVTQSVNGETETIVTPTSLSVDASAKTVKLVVPTVSQGSVVFSVSYQGLSAAAAPAFTIAAGGGGSGSGSSSSQSSSNNVLWISNTSAIFDGLLLTKIEAAVNTQVTKVEIMKNTVKLNDAIPVNGSISVNLIGAQIGDTLTLNAYNGSILLKSFYVTVQ
ncbi:S-layer homology domain-containing protein [Paenibacillus sp. WQ 127069]|uniref:S-layer homology domain-containing protein n=1 Tax=Paenibacillus baimaensis TaxID=2982185 RepID=A0ABT2UAV7_9BACL|nr:S-layer homology domain-containing protein [Paenibacillus sp. WQ 127069]MCU6791156.1 S-layer homology domain-containing protein [Paenibacillus sp. WQ 127069]